MDPAHLRFELTETAALVDRRHRPGSAVLIAGSGRSGTTWLAELLAATGRYRYCFEPFDHLRSPELGHLEYRYIRPDSTDPAFVGPVGDLFSGRIVRRRVDLHNPPSLHGRDGILVKEIYANLAVPWIGRQFPDVRIVLMTRHPGAVAVSRMRLRWPPFERRMLSQETLVADHLEPYLETIRTVDTEFERHVLMWCITNSVAMSHVRTSEGARVARYEDLRQSPLESLGDLFAWLGAPLTHRVMSRVDTPSQTTWSAGTSAAVIDEPGHREWADAPGADESAADELLEVFGLDDLYPPGRAPIVLTDSSTPAWR